MKDNLPLVSHKERGISHLSPIKKGHTGKKRGGVKNEDI
jgi:hypothetical protein